MKTFLSTAWILLLVAILSPVSSIGAETAVFVDQGKPLDVMIEGTEWKTTGDTLTGSGVGNYLFAGKLLQAGDFEITARLTIDNLATSAASLILETSHFGFEGGSGQMFVQGKFFGDETEMLGQTPVQPGQPFTVVVKRTGKTLEIRIDDQVVYKNEKFTDGPIGRFGLRPWRATMHLARFAATGDMIDLPKPALRTQPDSYTIPTIDLSHQKERQTVVERTEGQYLGHPTTVLMPDGKTIYVTYPLGHGGPAAVLKKSTDGGLTWSERLPVPENWATATNCPCLHRLTDPQGVERLFIFEGHPNMRQSVSTDGGATWTPLEPNGLHCIVAPITIVPIDDGKRLLAMYHRGREDKDRPPLELWQAISEDGGLTWGDERKVADYPAGNPCEPFVLRSPDGKQLAALARENARRYNSLLIVSNDEGRTWSDPVELPAALTGDRHMGRYAPDGRLLICFRDTTLASPTYGDFVAWVGTYDDIVNLREGQYRVRLLRSPKKGDLGYPGVEILPDGTFVATTYAVLAPGEKNSVVSIRVKLDEIDREAARLPETNDLFVSGQEGYAGYRIPSVVVTNQGTVLAFCEGRKNSLSDTGDIDMMLRRSTDGGKTFSPPRVVWSDAANTCGNPCPVVDKTTGTIFLLMTHNLGTDHEREIIDQTSTGTRTVWISQSEDDGQTWSKPVEITQSTKLPDWTWYATGPGAGIQTKDGRLVVPCDHIEADTDKYYSHVIYSDDHGKTWQLGGSAGPFTNECEVVELADGRLMLNMRNYDRSQHNRAVAVSNDGGKTWTAVLHDPALIEPICQASIRRYSTEAEEGRNRILFSNPAETGSRKEMTVRLSYDEGKTWPVGKVLYAGPSAYSCLARLPDGTILCFYENGLKSAYERITLARISLDWLTEGEEK